VEAVMLFGMGMTLTKEEDDSLRDVVQPCFAALGLANDYFSFDKEYEEFTKSGSTTFTNAVWLYIQWYGKEMNDGKRAVKDIAIGYEKKYRRGVEEYKHTYAPVSKKIERYLQALSYQIIGNVVWSLNCPRYYPSFRSSSDDKMEERLRTQADQGCVENTNGIERPMLSDVYALETSGSSSASKTLEPNPSSSESLSTASDSTFSEHSGSSITTAYSDHSSKSSSSSLSNTQDTAYIREQLYDGLPQKVSLLLYLEL
jgi:hypothetical protein